MTTIDGKYVSVEDVKQLADQFEKMAAVARDITAMVCWQAAAVATRKLCQDTCKCVRMTCNNEDCYFTFRTKSSSGSTMYFSIHGDSQNKWLVGKTYPYCIENQRFVVYTE